MTIPHDPLPPRWRPAVAGRFFTAVLLLFSAEASVRAVDYLGGHRPDLAAELAIIDRTMPIPAWGAVLAVTALLAVAGTVISQPRLVILAGILGGAAYAALAGGTALALLGLGVGFDGARAPVDFASKAIIWWIIAAASWWSGHVECQRRRMDDGAACRRGS
ncbi:hypothetical protein CSPHI_05095 [Corynebacterium sphenisci DSM 44792]|uniref:DoxX family protein n=1 Tax=Corynebacterium sphenisci DSM 44792 TaxID=1437874 RepID=A0A1L7CXD8_9CORY|nr:hypothetical protein [Corynebacterium sphenisci]APT90514.1 hypothetical protein CSPHI_05095 [Corynebacterium sphenisci DSM 44792]